MTYCSNCGLLVESYDCPVCGWKNIQPVKPNTPLAKPAARPEPRFQNGHAPHQPSLLVSGGIGATLVAVAAMLLGVIPILNMMFHGYVFEIASEELYYVLIIATMIFLVGGIILAAGFLGMFVHYRATSGIVAMVFAILAVFMLVTFTFIALGQSEADSSYYYYYHERTLSPIIWVGHLFVGLMAITMGTSLVMTRRRTGQSGMGWASGTLSLVSGALLIGFMGVLGIGWIFLSATCLVVASLFFSAGNGGACGTSQRQPA